MHLLEFSGWYMKRGPITKKNHEWTMNASLLTLVKSEE